MPKTIKLSDIEARGRQDAYDRLRDQPKRWHAAQLNTEEAYKLLKRLHLLKVLLTDGRDAAVEAYRQGYNQVAQLYERIDQAERQHIKELGKELVTPAQFAAEKGVSLGFILELCRSGQIPGILRNDPVDIITRKGAEMGYEAYQARHKVLPDILDDNKLAELSQQAAQAQK